jgi:N-acetylglucosaminyldiphosphoundecaprenol N-acetyl-beta-D-mannosaminyltransferase
MTVSDLMDKPGSTAERVPGSLERSVRNEDVDGELHRRWSHRCRAVGSVPFVARHPRAAAQDLVDVAAPAGRTRGEHVHLANAYSVALVRTHPGMGEVLDVERGWNLPDGKPVVWVSALRRDEGRLRQVRGPQFMLDVIDLGRAAGLRHYLLGGAPDTLALLERNLADLYPGVQIVGTDSPPFRAPTTTELVDRDNRIVDSGAHVVWVGLGTPKQDLEALRLATALPILALAVGAAFDFAAGTLKPAPHWVGAIGFEWLWRMLSEPRRLWRRYTFGNVQFIAAVIDDERRRRRARPVRRTR